MNLTGYDWIVINSSAGKDSQAMLDVIVEQADAQGVSRDRLVVAHADLGRAEWQGTRALAQEQAEHYGLRFEVVKRAQGDLLEHARKRGKWFSPTARYCTSDHKRGQVSRLLTQLAREAAGDPARILNCMGMRAQESRSRAALPVLKRDARQSNGRRTVDVWLPIHDWSVEQVWARIRQSGVRHHRAYDLGMPRLSCCFCIFAPKAALLLAGKHNRALLDEYVQVEQEIGHSFTQTIRLAEVKADLDAGVEPERVQDWTM
jgi:3'-phosphoadenosine 5'-phosphosulfate sulfotransferase (PAPS reductase)/FAD synthetase